MSIGYVNFVANPSFDDFLLGFARLMCRDGEQSPKRGYFYAKICYKAEELVLGLAKVFSGIAIAI
ncbi:hypothetical protein [Psychrobacter sp. UBA5136]|uniref:hypothetical protein n=1 Tax=Psychrobacter sp. UBA5136 TaxID=1947356 RepID=UPI0025E11162|nr:hypothetical protein [Psychrobacter sp. UBA5136]